MSGLIVLIGGGVRSGKSAFALSRARELGERRVFVATAQAFDAEMRARIDAHRDEREPSFRTIEEPLDVAGVLDRERDADVVVVDCLTLWLSNLLLADADDAAIDAAIGGLADAAARTPAHTIFVTNEVGLGIVPDNALARRFRDHAGRLHQRLAASADEIYLGTLGVMLRLSPGPIERVVPWRR